MIRPVYIESPGVYCAAGSDIESVWRSIVSGERNLSPLPCPAIEGTAWTQAFSAGAALPPGLNLDRKILRTMEKQAILALHGAYLALHASSVFAQTEKNRIGLYLGLPMIDEAVPPWCVLEAMHETGESLSTALCLRETPSFSALSELNSSACAHIAAKFGMTGAMGVYSPGADCGLEALIEAALSVSERENDIALTGAVSQKINPMLMLKYDHLGWLQDPAHIPGEGAAFALVQASSDAPRPVRISGYARGFIAVGANAEASQRVLIQQALKMAGIGMHHLGWILADSRPASGRAAVRDGSPAAFACSRHGCGDIGPAGPVLNLLLAAHGIRHGKRLLNNGSAAAIEETWEVKHALVAATGAEGQYVVVVLSEEKQ